MSAIDFMSWPVVPKELRPKALYHTGMSIDEGALLIQHGWAPQDVRIMPSKTDEDKAEAVKAWLEGVRLGSIDATRGVTKFVELEARILGLLESKKRVSEKIDIEAGTIDELLSFGKER